MSKQYEKAKENSKTKPVRANSTQDSTNITPVVAQPGIKQPTSFNSSPQVPPNYIPVVPQPRGNQQVDAISSQIPANYIPVVPQPGTTNKQPTLLSPQEGNASPQPFKRSSARIKAKKKL